MIQALSKLGPALLKFLERTKGAAAGLPEKAIAARALIQQNPLKSAAGAGAAGSGIGALIGYNAGKTDDEEALEELLEEIKNRRQSGRDW